jgi:hypothetical protein
MKFNKWMLGILLLAALVFSGCAKLENQIAANGGFFGSYNADYIVRNDSGGKIMDMWVLRNCMVQSVESGAGWLFRDDNGNPIHLGGDVKVIRVNKGVDMSKYHEYHAEFEKKSYQELYGQ